MVLYEPQDPVNIAATVRAMKNMGVLQLRLVRPVEYDPSRLEGIAHGHAGPHRARSSIFPTFDDAVADCGSGVGFTARRREAKCRISMQSKQPASCSTRRPDGPVAILFGREDSGLPNDVLDRAHAVVTIPTTDHASLNLAQAVLIALYELHLAAGDATRVLRAAAQGRAAADRRRSSSGFSPTLAKALGADSNSSRRAYAEHIMRSMRALADRAAPDARELMLLRAIAIEVVRYIERTTRRTLDWSGRDVVFPSMPFRKFFDRISQAGA